MTALERHAVSALLKCTMRLASRGKRFRNDLARMVESNPEYKLTINQALFLWDLVYTYRRQIADPILVKHGEHVRLTETLPPIYQIDDHREKAKHVKPQRTKSSRYQLELQRGGGRLRL